MGWGGGVQSTAEVMVCEASAGVRENVWSDRECSCPSPVLTLCPHGSSEHIACDLSAVGSPG